MEHNFFVTYSCFDPEKRKILQIFNKKMKFF